MHESEQVRMQRAGFLRRAALVAGSAAGASFVLNGRPAEPAEAQTAADKRALNLALVVEYAEADFYAGPSGATSSKGSRVARRAGCRTGRRPRCVHPVGASVEARHAAWMRYLFGLNPAAKAFDQPKSRAQITRVVRSTNVIAAPLKTRGKRSPSFTG